jgi:photosystem II stability/assembly factor-like uncharacterized protein
MKTRVGSGILIGLALAAGSLAPLRTSAAGPAWQVSGPAGGTIVALAIQPGGNSSLLLAGTGGAGIFRSDNGGSSWSPSRTGLPPDTMVNAIAFANSAPQTVYAATSSGGGFRSNDAGRSWLQVWTDSGITDVAVDHFDSQRIVITAGIGVYLSTDGGAHWSELLQGLDRIAADRVLFAPSEPNVLYVGAVAGVIRTDDYGQTWRTADVGPTNVTALAIDSQDSDRLFAASLSDGVFRSADGGESWVVASDGLPVVPSSPEIHLPVLSLAIHPTQPSFVYAGTARGGSIYRSTNGGDSWSAMPLGISAHVVRAFAMDPADGRPLYAALEYEGLLRSTDGGDSWSHAHSGLVGSAVESLLVRPGSAKVVVAGTVGQGIFRSTDAAATWQRTGLAGMRIDGLSSVPGAPQRIYAAASGGLFRSVDGGAAWGRVSSLNRRGLVDVAVAPSAPKTVYVISYSALWRSTNGGQTWQRMRSLEPLSSVTVHPRKSRTIFLGIRGAVLRSDDGGASWEDLPSGLQQDADPRQVTVDPQRPWIVYAAMEPQGFFRSRDGGRTWRPLGQELGLWWARAVVLDPLNSSRVYIGGFDATFGGGVYRSKDRGATWQSLGRNGLSTTWISSLAVAADSSRIFAGTTAYGLESGGGAFSRVLP